MLISSKEWNVGLSEKINPSKQYASPTWPYLGNLGGKKVLLPYRLVHFVEYNDSPGFDPEKWRNYKSPPRTYDSPIKSFGYYFQYHTNYIHDWFNHRHIQAEKNLRNPSMKWLSIGITSGVDFREKGYLNHLILIDKPSYVWSYSKTHEDKFGLETYVQMNIDPDTGKPFRYTEDRFSQDAFVARDVQGNAVTVITCLNHTRIKTCQHFFDADGGLKVNFEVRYHRDNLRDWQKIEEAVKLSLQNFMVKEQ